MCLQTTNEKHYAASSIKGLAVLRGTDEINILFQCVMLTTYLSSKMRTHQRIYRAVRLACPRFRVRSNIEENRKF